MFSLFLVTPLKLMLLGLVAILGFTIVRYSWVAFSGEADRARFLRSDSRSLRASESDQVETPAAGTCLSGPRDSALQRQKTEPVTHAYYRQLIPGALPWLRVARFAPWALRD